MSDLELHVANLTIQTTILKAILSDEHKADFNSALNSIAQQVASEDSPLRESFGIELSQDQVFQLIDLLVVSLIPLK